MGGETNPLNKYGILIQPAVNEIISIIKSDNKISYRAIAKNLILMTLLLINILNR